MRGTLRDPRGSVDGVIVAKLVQAEGAGPGDVHGAGNGAGVVPEQPRHFLRRLQVALGVGEQAVARIVDGAVFPNAGEDILKRPPLGGVGMHVVDRHQGNLALGGETGQV